MKSATRAKKLILSYLRKVEKQQAEKGEDSSVSGNYDDVETMLNELADYHIMVSEDVADDTNTLDLQEGQVSAFEAGIKLGKQLASNPVTQLFYISLSGPDEEDIDSLGLDYHLAYFVAKDANEVYDRVKEYLES